MTSNRRGGAGRPVVLVLIKGLGIGGAERLIATSIPFWDRDSFDYRVAYLLPWKDQLTGTLEAGDVQHMCLGNAKGSVVHGMIALTRLVRSWEVDLIHAHLPLTGLMARFLPSGPPVVYTEHNLQAAYRPLTRLMNRASYRLNAAITGVSAAVVASAQAGDMETVVNGVAPAVVDVDGVRDELGIGSEIPLVVHVGNIRPNKGHEDLIEAARSLKQHVPEFLIVSIGGEKYGGELERLMAMAREARVDRHVRFLGRRPDARSFIGAADVYLSPARIEGLPVTILEALSAARPVVATATGGVPDLIHDGRTGILVRPADSVAMAEALAAVIKDPQGGATLGKEGARLVEERFGLGAMVERYESIYARVLGLGSA